MLLDVRLVFLLFSVDIGPLVAALPPINSSLITETAAVVEYRPPCSSFLHLPDAKKILLKATKKKRKKKSLSPVFTTAHLRTLDDRQMNNSPA